MSVREARDTRKVKSNRATIRALDKDKASKLETGHNPKCVIHRKASKPAITKVSTGFRTL